MNAVEWSDRARDELADLYVAASVSERSVIEERVLTLERDLSKNPHVVGESRSGRLRFEVRVPLAFWFAVFPPDDRVRIVRVTRPRRK